MEASCVCVSYKPLNAGNNQQTIVCVHFPTRKHAASVGLRLARMNVSSGLSDTYATPSVLLHLFLCCVGRWNVSSTSCH